MNPETIPNAIHFAEEFTGCFRKHRKALPVIALTESAHLTCVASDYVYPPNAGYEYLPQWAVPIEAIRSIRFKNQPHRPFPHQIVIQSDLDQITIRS